MLVVPVMNLHRFLHTRNMLVTVEATSCFVCWPAAPWPPVPARTCVKGYLHLRLPGFRPARRRAKLQRTIKLHDVPLQPFAGLPPNHQCTSNAPVANNHTALLQVYIYIACAHTAIPEATTYSRFRAEATTHAAHNQHVGHQCPCAARRAPQSRGTTAVGKSDTPPTHTHTRDRTIATFAGGLIVTIRPSSPV